MIYQSSKGSGRRQGRLRIALITAGCFAGITACVGVEAGASGVPVTPEKTESASHSQPDGLPPHEAESSAQGTLSDASHPGYSREPRGEVREARKELPEIGGLDDDAARMRAGLTRLREREQSLARELEETRNRLKDLQNTSRDLQRIKTEIRQREAWMKNVTSLMPIFENEPELSGEWHESPEYRDQPGRRETKERWKRHVAAQEKEIRTLQAEADSLIRRKLERHAHNPANRKDDKTFFQPLGTWFNIAGPELRGEIMERFFLKDRHGNDLDDDQDYFDVGGARIYAYDQFLAQIGYGVKRLIWSHFIDWGRHMTWGTNFANEQYKPKYGNYPAGGWKMHVSADWRAPEDLLAVSRGAMAVIRAVLPNMEREGIDYKLLNGTGKFSKMRGTQTGKFITIYAPAHDVTIGTYEVPVKFSCEPASEMRKARNHGFYDNGPKTLEFATKINRWLKDAGVAKETLHALSDEAMVGDSGGVYARFGGISASYVRPVTGSPADGMSADEIISRALENGWEPEEIGRCGKGQKAWFKDERALLDPPFFVDSNPFKQKAASDNPEGIVWELPATDGSEDETEVNGSGAQG